MQKLTILLFIIVAMLAVPVSAGELGITSGYTLSVTATNGSVAKSPDQASYDHESLIQLTATPDPGYRFDSWSGDYTGTTNPAQIVITSNMNVTANFVLETTYDIDVYFAVNMDVQVEKGAFNQTEDTVYVSGSFNGWELQQLSLVAGDSINAAQVTINGAIGDTVYFKYRYRDLSDAPGTYHWEDDPNRMIILDTPAVGYIDFFNRESVYVPTYPVAMTFSVNMELERLSGRFDPGTDTVSVNGGFNGWTALTDIMSPNGLNPDIYEVTVNLNVSVGEMLKFKYWYTDGVWESVADREYTITQADVDNGYASFDASFNNGTLETVINQSCTVLFTVNTTGAMSAVDNNPFASVNTVHIAGSSLPLQWPAGGWPDADSTKMVKLFDDGTNGDVTSGDNIFSRELIIPAYTVLDMQYKYSINFGDAANNGGGNDNEAGFAQNHDLHLERFMTSATTVDTFGNMGAVTLDNVVNPVPVTYNVNMKIQMKRGDFVASEDTVYILGTLNGWSPDMMTDVNNDSIYSVTLNSANAGDTIEFKFRFRDGSAAADVWENDPNRMYVIPSSPATFEDYFNRDSVYVEQFDIQVFFAVNMELERLSGRFDPASDTVSVNGSFNGWSPMTDILAPNGLNPDIYEGMVTIKAGVGESIMFKFWYTPNNWESVSDRVFTFADSNISSLTAYIEKSFNDGTLETVLNQPLALKLTCNVDGAISSQTTNPFPVINTVHVAGSASPFSWPSGGWPDSDSSLMVQLFDDGTHGDMTSGDMIFTADLTIPAYTVLRVEYKYSINFGDAANNEGGNDNEAGFAQNHVLELTKFMSSATVLDTFGMAGVSDLADVLGFDDDVTVTPAVFSLGQNYPNPFNPSTTINYSLASASPVALNVYDMLGRLVETVVNNEQPAGNYTVTFAPKNLPSGIYYYRIVTNSFTQTKTMMFVK